MDLEPQSRIRYPRVDLYKDPEPLTCGSSGSYQPDVEPEP